MNNIYDELRASLYSIWHRRWLALAVAWGVCMLGWLAVAMVPNTYEAKAKILVQLDTALDKQIGLDIDDRRRNVERVRQTLSSATNLEKVIRATRLNEGVSSPKQMEAAVLLLGKSIKVVAEQDNLFVITADSHDGSLSDAENSKLSQDIAQKLIDIFREENLAGDRSDMGRNLQFMDQQLTDRQKQLESAEARRLAFEAKNPEASLGGASLIQKMDTSRTEMRGFDADIAAAQSALAAINGQLAGTPQSLPGAAGPVGSAHAALGQAMAELSGMRARGLTENHPDVIAARNQVASMRAAAAAEGSAGSSGTPNPAYSSLQSIRAEREASLQALITRRGSAQSDLARLGSQQLSNPVVAEEAQRISRDYDVLKQQYDKLLQDREQLRLKGQVDSDHNAVKFQIIDPPTMPRSPIAPNRPLLLALVLVLGLGAGVGASFAVGQLRSTFATTSKLERSVGLPVLGAISMSLTEAARAKRNRHMRYFYIGAAALAGLFVLLLSFEFIQRSMVA